jgi:Skp family chaperone for outer membrane proteins
MGVRRFVSVAALAALNFALFTAPFDGWFCSQLHAQGREKRVTPVDSTQRATFERDRKVGVAILVGIGTYPRYSGLGELRYPARDADLLESELSAQRYTVITLKNAEATRGAILNAIRQSGEVIDAERGTLVFFFSGHGFAEGNSNYLASYDATSNDLARSGLDLGAVEKAMIATGARRRVMWVDACRNEPGKGAGDGRSFARFDSSAGTRILFSTKAGRLSYEDDDLKQGLFSYYLARGLHGDAARDDGLISFRDLADFVVDGVESRSLKQGRVQVPYEAGESSGDFLLARSNGSTLVAEPKPAISSTADASPAGTSTTSPRRPSPSAPAALAVLDFRKALLNTQEIKAASAALQAKYKPRQEALGKAQREESDLQTRAQSARGNLSAAGEADLSAAVERKHLEVQRLTEDLQSDVNRERDEIIRRVGEKMTQIVSQAAEQAGIGGVIDSSDIVVFAPELDISNSMTERYDNAARVSEPLKARSGKIAVVDLRVALLETQELKKASTDLQAKYKPRQDALTKAQREESDLQAQIQAAKGKLSPAAQTNLNAELERKHREVQRLTEDLQADVNTERNEVIQRAAGKMISIARKFAREGDVSVVVDSGALLYAARDIEVSAYLTARHDSAEAGRPAPPLVEVRSGKIGVIKLDALASQVPRLRPLVGADGSLRVDSANGALLNDFKSVLDAYARNNGYVALFSREKMLTASTAMDVTEDFAASAR